MEKSKKENISFTEIQTIADLKKYLNDPQRLNNGDYLYHYTTTETVVEIIKSQKWILSNPKDMNDKLEYGNGSKEKWDNLFFASFMKESKESIGMWSMYSQPWNVGAKIAIPKAEFKKWINNTNNIHCRKGDSRKTINVGEQNSKIYISAVAYSNTDSLEDGEIETVKWSNRINKNFTNVSHCKELTGYIKDVAWDYEKEVRLNVTFNNEEKFEKVDIDIPDFIIDSMVITVGPKCENNAVVEMQNAIEKQINIEKSMFTNKLYLKAI